MLFHPFYISLILLTKMLSVVLDFGGYFLEGEFRQCLTL